MMDTLHLTLRMTAAEAVETSVTTTNSLSQDYTNLDVTVFLKTTLTITTMGQAQTPVIVNIP